ncbi:restriction endonuclease subunit S [Flavobacterium sp. CGRL1]
METLQSKLRFPEFQGDWDENVFENLVKINQGLQIPISERFLEEVENSYFYITNEFLKEGSQKKYFIKNPTQSVLCTEDDILMTRTGNTGMVVTNVKGAFHNNFFKIQFPETINKGFLYYFLVLDKTQNLIKSLAGTSTIPDLNHSDFYKIEFIHPSLTEQTKIANFLSSIDEKINLLKEKKALLEEYKKGMMQKIFNQEIRFKDDNGNDFEDWEEKRLGDLCIIKGRIGYRGYTVKDIVKKGEGAITLSPSNINNGKLTFENSTYISWDKYYESPEIMIEENDVVLVKTASVGKSAIVKNVEMPATINPQFVILKKIKIDPAFLAYVIYDPIIQKQIVSAVGSGAVPNLSQESISNFTLPVPQIEEQTKIANFLSAIDEKVGLMATQIEDTQEYKKGLLQQMFV